MKQYFKLIYTINENKFIHIITHFDGMKGLVDDLNYIFNNYKLSTVKSIITMNQSEIKEHFQSEYKNLGYDMITINKMLNIFN